MKAAAIVSLCIVMAAAPAAGQGGLAWRQARNGQGFGILIGPSVGDPVFSLSCVRGASTILAIAHGVRPVAGRQEFEVRIDQRRFTFLVKPEAIKDGKMVQATAKASPELLVSIRASK